ncbi:hypothetical protein Nepgr_033215 [Nepenthes gracilis]|uniref:ubiquitinyl hydrolase 1 n=1 Tax=Nepenthes gracilis TaxID=150966 RepID=A0AAD3TL07_NEPGR|nr:hypothetical protein Nepgr_033215 [Nepenthes gracilis]
MLAVGDLGFRVAAVVFFVVFPAIGFIVHRKWRLAVARREEIKRLLALASEEAARAEVEATINYGVAPVSSHIHHCAVCFNPTTTRCARCKVVRYCSGKCQILHWRQGHKDDCSPPLANLPNDEGNDFTWDGVKRDHCGNFVDSIEDEIEQSGSSHEKPELNSIHSPQASYGKDGNCQVDHSPDGNRTCFASGISDNLASSGFSKPFPGDKSYNGNSIYDDDCLHDLNTSDEKHSSSASNALEADFTVKCTKQTKLLSPEFICMAEPINNSHSSSDLKGDTPCRASISSGLITGQSGESSLAECAASSGFWDGFVDSGKGSKYAQTDTVKPIHSGAGYRDTSVSRSFVGFSFNLSGNLPSDLHLHGSKAPDDAYPGASGIHKQIDQSNLPKEEPVDALKGGCSTTCSSEESNSVAKYRKYGLCGVMSAPLSLSSLSVCRSSVGKPSVEADALKTSSLASAGSERPCSVTSNSNVISQSVDEGVGSSHFNSNDHSSSEIKGQSPILKSIKVVSVPDYSAIPHPVSNNPPNASVGLKTYALKVVDQLCVSKSKYYSFGGSDDVGKNSQKGLFPYDLFVDLYNWNKVELRPCGLINCGNSCYVNVVLQCLAFTPPLTAYLLQGLHSKSCIEKECCFTCEFERLILASKEGGSPLSPIGIISQIRKIGSHLVDGREEDAHEFLRYAIESMQSICLRKAGASRSSVLEEETNLIGLTFGGCLRSKVRCMRCHGKSARNERMMDLTVEVDGDIETLEEALGQFTGTELLDGDNKYECGRCKSKEKAKKKLTILEAPNVLTIALKRFQSGNFGKLNKSVQFPEILDLAPYMKGASDKSPIYRLYGVVVHLDILNSTFSGHYVCYVRNVQNKWFKIDDSSVKPVDQQRVLIEGAYMLFYSRCSPRAPRSIRSTILSRESITKIKQPQGDASRVGKNISSRSGDRYRDKPKLPRTQNALEMDSSSDNSSIFSHSDEVSSTADSNRESASTDDFSDYIFGDSPYGWSGYPRNSSDSDTSSSSSSSSSFPPSARHSTLLNSQRYASGDSNSTTARSDIFRSRAKMPGDGGGASFLGPKLVHSSSCRETDSERLGWPNSLDNVKSGAYLRRSLTKRSD